MIQIRNRPRNLQTFAAQRVANLKNQLRNKVASGENITNADLDQSIWKTEEVKDALFSSQHKKCCFCENIRAPKREFDGEHFRPKLGVSEDPNHRGYWWLAYEWSNLYYACKTCNQEFKKNHFPVGGQRAYNEDDSLVAEQAVIINPETENPEDFIGFDWQQSYGKLVIATGIDNYNRGNETIRIVGLNFPQLMEERAAIVTLLQDASNLMHMFLHQNNMLMIQQQGDKIRELTSSRRRFAGFHRAFFRGAGLANYISND